MDLSVEVLPDVVGAEGEVAVVIDEANDDAASIFVSALQRYVFWTIGNTFEAGEHIGWRKGVAVGSLLFEKDVADGEES